jgi:uncharacterized protein YrrD
MFIEARKIIKLPVAADDVISKVGEVEQIIVDPETGHLVGFLISTGGFFSTKKALSVTDIIEWDPNGLITKSIENLVDPSEIIRIKNVVDKGIFLIGMKAQTESGKNLGQIDNFLIDTATEQVVKYYLHDLLGNSRIIPADKVVKIDKVIVFKEDIDMPQGVAGVQAA